MPRPRVLVLRTAGTNCDAETCVAFETAGAVPERVHLGRVAEDPKLLGEYDLLALPGGFSYGDDIAAGRILAQQLQQRLAEPLRDFLAAGKPVIGICNGFQVLVKAGVLPGPLDGRIGQLATLADNATRRFEDRWVHVRAPATGCVWTKNLASRYDGGPTLHLPVAHGEGRFLPADEGVQKALHDANRVALVYARPDGSPTNGDFPVNPNASADDVAGVCDATGLCFGLMPHPERHVRPMQHPTWTRLDVLPNEGDGLQVFRNGVERARG